MYHDLGAELMGSPEAACIIWRACRTPPTATFSTSATLKMRIFSLAQATAWASAQRDMQTQHPWALNRKGPTGHSGLDAPEYRIRAAADTDAFTYDRRQWAKIIDLVRSPTWRARDLLAQFDLDIRKASFDGRVSDRILTARSGRDGADPRGSS